MKATDTRYHVGLGMLMEQHGNRFSFDRTASFSDLWAILFWNLIRHPVKTTLRAKSTTPGVRTW